MNDVNDETHIIPALNGSPFEPANAHELTRVTVHLTHKAMEAVRAAAKEENLSYTDIINRSVTSYVPEGRARLQVTGEAVKVFLGMIALVVLGSCAVTGGALVAILGPN